MFKERITEDETQNIHDNSMWILENVGVLFEDETAVELFKKHGMKTEGNKVLIDRKLVDKAVNLAPSSFVVEGSNSSVKIGEGESVLVGPTGNISILKGKEIVSPKLEDFIDIQKLVESSSAISMVTSNTIEIEDIDQDRHVAVKTAAALKYSGKPLVGFAGTGEEALESIDIARKFYGCSHSHYILGVSNMISPLKYGKDAIDVIEAYAKNNQPICISCCSLPGMTSPITLGGTIVQNNAEIIAGIVLTQLMNPGNPVVYGNTSFGCDMRYATSTTGSIETCHIIPYAKRLSEYYKVPCRAGCSLTDSKILDWQAGVESYMTISTSLLNHVDFIFHSAGEYDSINIFSMAKFLLDEENIIMLRKHINRGPVKDDNMLLESIKNVGPGNQFIMEPSTFEYFKSELFTPEFSTKTDYGKWFDEGELSSFDKAEKTARERLDSYVQPDLSASQLKYLNDLIDSGSL